MNYVLGLDNGGTTTKAAIYGMDGTEFGSASTETRMLVPYPDFAERDMEEMWQANCSVIREVLEKTVVPAQEIACVAVCGHGKGLYLWGKDNRPVRNGIVSADNRAWAYPERWKRDGTEKAVFQKSFQHILPSQPVSLLAWLKDHEPDVLPKVQWIFECKDYVRFRLTGEAYGEISDYSGANFVNLNMGTYDEQLLALFGLKDCMDKLPILRQSTDLCGYITPEVASLTGLRAGTPVAGGAFDIDACAIAVGLIDERHICMIAGTWSINEYLSKSPVTDGSVMMNSFFCIPGYYLIEECSPTSAGNLEWFIRTLLPELTDILKENQSSIYPFLDAYVQDTQAERQSPIFLPFLMASNVHPNAKGSFVGISNYHKREHIVRSIFEGVAFSHRYHLDHLLRSRLTPPQAIRLAGGVARSKVWVQMFADVMQLPVEVVQVNETGTLGCAMIGATAIGRYSSLLEAARSMCRVAPAVMPNSTLIPIYSQRYALYLEIINALDGVWEHFQHLR